MNNKLLLIILFKKLLNKNKKSSLILYIIFYFLNNITMYSISPFLRKIKKIRKIKSCKKKIIKHKRHNDIIFLSKILILNKLFFSHFINVFCFKLI